MAETPYLKGKKAWYEGKSALANPYKNVISSQEYKSWNEGWNSSNSEGKNTLIRHNYTQSISSVWNEETSQWDSV
jgi:hypothetical protein